MGRSGGGGGGGHVSGGGFSGGHVSGGGSHRGPSAPRGSSGRSSDMGGGPFRRGPVRGGGPIYVGGPRMYRRGPIYRGPMMGGPVMGGPVMGGPAMAPSSGGGCFGCGGLATSFAIVMLFLLFAFFALTLNVCSGPDGYESTTVTEVPGSTQEREALPLGEARQTRLYEDADGDWIRNSSAMEKGLEEFYQKTGVRPFVYIAPNGSLATSGQCTQLAQELYPEITDDQAHLVLVFCDDNQGGFVYGYDMGSDAATVLDQEAMNILAAYLGRYYDTAASEEEIFSDAFSATANRIMHVEQPWYVAAAPIIIVAIVVFGVLAIIFAVRTKRREQEAHVREILNQPLEKFGDQELRDLERKYENSDPGSSLDDREADLEARYADLERRERNFKDTYGNDG